jgi:glycosyltransferase involved in cell wall biosynthesis
MAFSIIIPIYNVSPYLDACLQSVTSQASCKDEVILVDDGSTDNSLEIAKRYMSDNVKVVSKPNRGLSSARNVGIRMASKEFLIFIDSDDWIEAGSLNIIRNKVVEAEDDIFILNTRIVHKRYSKIISPNISYLKEKLAYVPPAAWDKIYRRVFVQKCNIEFPEGMAFEDMPFTYELLIKAKSVKKLEDVLINWRQRENSISRSSCFQEYNADVLLNIDTLKYRNSEYFKKNPDQLLLIIAKKGLLDNLRRWFASKQGNIETIEKIVDHTIKEAGGLSRLLFVLNLAHQVLLIFLLMRYQYAKFNK